MVRATVVLLLLGTNAVVTAADPPLADPFPEDRALFVVTPAGVSQHARRLSAGHQALLQTHPDYEIPVYPTRRSVSFPEAVDAATAQNRGRAKLKGADAIEGARLGIPFPEPRSGIEVLWNHRLRYRGDATEWRYHRATVWPKDGQFVDTASEQTLYRYANVRDPADLATENIHSYNRLAMKPCEDQRDLLVLWHDPVNALLSARKVWGGPTDSDARGHIRRYGPVGYDEVGICSHRIRTFDMVDMFSGGFDRYTFKLLGRREMIVPYNAYRLSDPRHRVASLARPGHFDQRNARYELHRVWIVDASLRPDQGHAVARRVFYVDEDSWSIVLVDGYDREGRLSRFQEGHLVALPSIQAVDYAPVITYDLRDGRYFVDRMLSESFAPHLSARLKPSDFSPTAVMLNGIRN